MTGVQTCALPICFSGYGLLILSLFDIFNILIPIRLIDPLWQFQAMGQLVDRAPIIIVGVFLVFYGSRNKMAKWEIFFLKIICWGTLLAGIGYLLFVPLGVFSSLQIDRSTDNQVKQQIAQNITQIESIKGRLEAVNTEAQMQALLNRIQGLPPEIRESQQLGESKKRLTDLITKSGERLRNQLKQTYFQRDRKSTRLNSSHSSVSRMPSSA